MASSSLHRPLLRWCGLLAICAAACSGLPAAPATTATAKPSTIRLVVLIVIDQLPAWSFEHDRRALKGGIDTLLERGTYFTQALIPYASTFTGAGHAALGTGAAPRATGVIANRWFDRTLGRRIVCTQDPSVETHWLSPDPPPDAPRLGDSPAILQVEGISDALYRVHPDARSVGVAIKARAAILPLGHRARLAVFLDGEQWSMTTNTYYTDEVPAWLRQLREDHPIRSRIDQVWDAVSPALLAQLSGNVDDGPGEDGSYGLGTTFPKNLGRTPDPARALRATPLANAVTLETALAAIEGEDLGADDIPDFLAISFSSHDYAGHLWGQESWERVDILLDTDRRIAEVIEMLDRRIGRSRYGIILTSDHGATPMVEQSRARGHRAYRISHERIRQSAQHAAEATWGPGRWIADVAKPMIFLSAAALAKPPDERAQVLKRIRENLMDIPGMGWAIEPKSFATGCRGLTEELALLCRSVDTRHSGDIFFAPRRYSVIVDSDRGTAHGGPSLEDRHVPLIVVGPGWPASERSETVSTLQVAPTLARLLGIPPPRGAHEAALEPAP